MAVETIVSLADEHYLIGPTPPGIVQPVPLISRVGLEKVAYVYCAPTDHSADLYVLPAGDVQNYLTASKVPLGFFMGLKPEASANYGESIEHNIELAGAVVVHFAIHHIPGLHSSSMN